MKVRKPEGLEGMGIQRVQGLEVHGSGLWRKGSFNRRVGGGWAEERGRGKDEG
jgi:hypothetical protein